MITFNSANMPGLGDPDTWGNTSGHPNSPDYDEDRAKRAEELAETKIRKQLVIASQIKCHDDMTYQEHFAETTQIAVADNLIRYLNDADVVYLINAVLEGSETKVFASVENLINDSIKAVAESNAEAEDWQ